MRAIFVYIVLQPTDFSLPKRDAVGAAAVFLAALVDPCGKFHWGLQLHTLVDGNISTSVRVQFGGFDVLTGSILRHDRNNL